MFELLGSYALMLIGVLLILFLLLLINYRNKSNARVQKLLLEASLSELQKQTAILRKIGHDAYLPDTEHEQDDNVLENAESPYPKFSAER